MDPDIVPLREYLAPVPAALDPLELEDCKIAWHKIIVIPCNWKTVLDAFNEGYHVEGTHPQIMKYGRPRSVSEAFGAHSWFHYPTYRSAFDLKNAKKLETEPEVLKGDVPDFRKLMHSQQVESLAWLKSLVSDYSVEAARRLSDVLPADAPFPEVTSKFFELHRQVIEEAGAKWPEGMTRDALAKAGTDWHMFPNTICLPCADGALWYRATPNGDDPESCIFDIWWLMRFGEGKEPEISHDFYDSPDKFQNVNPFLEQDFANLLAIQAGVHSRGFKGARTNPVQEVAISNFHRTLHRYLGLDG